MSEYKSIRLSPEMKKRMREAHNNPIGFKCWDCGDEVMGLDLYSEEFKKSPVSIGGYKLVICEECWDVE